MSAAPQQKQIRFVHNQGQPPSKRRRINAACLTCRKRKTRCAGERPVCSTCTKNGHECLGYTEIPDKKEDATGERLADAKQPGNDNGDSLIEEAEERSTIQHEGRDDRVDLKHVKSEGARATTNNVIAGSKRRPNDSTSHSTTAAARRPSAPTSRQPSVKSHDTGLSQSHNTDEAARGKHDDGSRHQPAATTASQNQQQPLQPLQPPPPPSAATQRPQTSQSEENMSRSAGSQSPVLNFKEKLESHRVPYFRYFGPTAIVPGYKQMVVSVRGRRRSTGGSASGTSPSSNGLGQIRSLASVSQEDCEQAVEELPVYDVNDSAPVDPLIMHLVKTFFVHLGCNYPFLREERFTRMVEEKRVESILVDAVCALSARFSDAPQIVGDGKLAKSEYGQQYAQRAKAATVDTFPAPSVGAVQALLMMAYEGFGANQDSALWMYLGLAIRMAVDLGLQKVVGIKYQGEKDPWYIRHWNRGSSEAESMEQQPADDESAVSREQQIEVEQERMDTFWTVFILDRVISSGTGRPVTFRDDDFEFGMPKAKPDPATGYPNPFPTFVRIIHLYGRVSDVLNTIHGAKDLTPDKWTKLAKMENELTRLYQAQNPKLHFNVGNFRWYLTAGQGTTFILMHFWFHAMIIILHQPTLLTSFGSMSRTHQLLPNSRELSMSSAKTIADILSFAELIGPTSFIGNPFTSQPMYIAGCAFLMESAAMASHPSSRDASPPPPSYLGRPELNQRQGGGENDTSKSTKHSLLASAANQNYSRCYNSLQQLHQYWGGVKYILTALDQKSKGIWDCETYTDEEYESTRITPARAASLTHNEFMGSPSSAMPPFAWSITGATNSPTSSLTLMYQNMQAGQQQQGQQGSQSTGQGPPPSHPQPSTASHRTQPTPAARRSPLSPHIPGSDTRHSHMEAPSPIFSPVFPQATTSAVRHSPGTTRAQPPARPRNGSTVRPTPHHRRRSSLLSPERIPASPARPYSMSPHTTTMATSPLTRNQPQQLQTSMAAPPTPFQANAQTAGSSAFDTTMLPSTTPSSTFTGDTPGSGHASMGTTNMYDTGFGGNGNGASFSYMDHNMGPIGDLVTFENPVDIGSLGLPHEMMPQWLDYLPSDVLGMFENNGGGGSGGHNSSGNNDDNNNNHHNNGGHGGANNNCNSQGHGDNGR